MRKRAKKGVFESWGLASFAFLQNCGVLVNGDPAMLKASCTGSAWNVVRTLFIEQSITWQECDPYFIVTCSVDSFVSVIVIATIKNYK